LNNIEIFYYSAFFRSQYLLHFHYSALKTMKIMEMEIWSSNLQGGMCGWADGGWVTSVKMDSLLEASTRFWDSCVDFSGKIDILGGGHTSVWPWREDLIWKLWGAARAPGRWAVRRAKPWTLQKTTHIEWIWSIIDHFIATQWDIICVHDLLIYNKHDTRFQMYLIRM